MTTIRFHLERQMCVCLKAITVDHSSPFCRLTPEPYTYVAENQLPVSWDWCVSRTRYRGSSLRASTCDQTIEFSRGLVQSLVSLQEERERH